ncbi:hypothetical protein RB195_008222 [Necator americanus]|uniref:Gem-associated protein 2 n=2 Tax=Necator americanus TaxID=51031 RepID=W2SNG9_NECAM|nr:hypothetical protein NECAME_00918 [Necator americanus]ETN71229.1 hypothetical protein NECAME_00918 [Necator americanus]
MDRGQFVDIGEFDINAVDMDCAPQSAEHYLQQVIADRVRGPSCVSMVQPSVSELVSEKEAPPSVQERDPRAPPREWCKAKVAEFSAFRSRVEKAPRKRVMKLKWPNMSDAEQWEDVLLRRCHPKCTQFLSSFPNHQGTPPAVPIVLSMSSALVETLIQYAVEWAECDGFSRALREWLFVLLLLVHKPLMPDVCAAMRALANLCRNLRSSMDVERKDEIRELSWFISVVGEYFGQTDLADL